MTPLFTKLNLKDHREIVVLNAPDGFEGVRQVAVDEDWSALRFRRVASEAGRARVSGGESAS